MDMELPEGMTLEAAAWLETRIVIANARTAAVLRAEVEKVDDWASGVFVALRDTLQQLLTQAPGLADALAPSWRDAAASFEQIDALGLPALDGESLEFLEARKMLYRSFKLQGLMRDQAPAMPRQRVR
ncbi:MAG: hypothetical protein E6Q67_14235 [Roseateles sp.]|nr:MAG: hypothetical protein E6Q67_14235 [Roseateles sp.]